MSELKIEEIKSRYFDWDSADCGKMQKHTLLSQIIRRYTNHAPDSCQTVKLRDTMTDSGQTLECKYTCIPNGGCERSTESNDGKTYITTELLDPTDKSPYRQSHL